MGRPSTTNPRNYQLNISFTHAEIELLRDRANEAQMRLVDYGRLVLLRKSSQPIIAHVPQVDRLTFEQLKRIGNNLNQLARVANATRQAPPAALDELLHAIREVLNRGAVLGSETP